MDILTLLQDLLFDYTLRTVAAGSAILGAVSGALGAYAVLRRQSLLGDAISHAALPGVVIAFLLLRSKEPMILVIGAAVSGWLAAAWMMSIIRNTRVKQDAAMGLVLSVFFGVGMMLLTFTQRLPDARQAGLSDFLFGQAAALLERDVLTMGLLGGISLLLMLAFWKEFKLISFDPQFGATLGLPIRLLDSLLTLLLVIAIVIGLQAVGVVLMSAMIVAPAAAARQWTDRLAVMILLSALFGALAGVIGTLISSLLPGLATGPTIVLVVSFFVLVSILFAPNRGLVADLLRRRQQRRQMNTDAVLENLYALAGQHADQHHPHSVEVLRAMSANPESVAPSLKALKEQGLVSSSAGQWSLTEQGADAARRGSERRVE